MSPQRSWLVVLLSIVLARSAAAQELIAGFEGGPSYGLGSVSPIFSVPFDATQAVIIKPTVSYLYYEKRTLLGESQITAPALSLGLGYRYNDEKFAFAAAPSIQVLWERQKNLFGPDTNRTRFGVLFAGDASLADEPDLFAWHVLHALVANALRRPVGDAHANGGETGFQRPLGSLAPAERAPVGFEEDVFGGDREHIG